ncbi:cell division protein FtsL [Brevibacillus marinus]|uniref:cell division protein FtsL n=1 Tax=Brevibacillus marinus TaxID=2496837 RepID=UPI000F84C37A|nr:septum formation initiator family protein [Brevibacillus marinus]
MAYYYRGNLAVDVDKSPRVKQKKTIVIRPSLPTGEKLLYLFMILLVVAGAGFVGLRYSQISEYNYQIEKTKQEMAALQEENTELMLRIEQMSSRERIEQQAKEMGMVPAETVLIIGGAQTTDNEQPAKAE